MLLRQALHDGGSLYSAAAGRLGGPGGAQQPAAAQA
jgi:hypothetical protein